MVEPNPYLTGVRYNGAANCFEVSFYSGGRMTIMRISAETAENLQGQLEQAINAKYRAAYDDRMKDARHPEGWDA